MKASLERGSAFEVLIRTKGWDYIKLWYQGKVQVLASALLLQEEKSIDEFEPERRELIGLRKLLGMVDGDIKALNDYNEKAKKSTKK